MPRDQFFDRRIDTRLAQLNVQQRAVDAVRAYCPQRLVAAVGRPDDRAFEGDKDLADKLRDEQFVLGDERPADHGAAKAHSLPDHGAIIMLVLSVIRALSAV